VVDKRGKKIAQRKVFSFHSLFWNAVEKPEDKENEEGNKERIRMPPKEVSELHKNDL